MGRGRYSGPNGGRPRWWTRAEDRAILQAAVRISRMDLFGRTVDGARLRQALRAVAGEIGRSYGAVRARARTLGIRPGSLGQWDTGGQTDRVPGADTDRAPGRPRGRAGARSAILD